MGLFDRPFETATQFREDCLRNRSAKIFQADNFDEWSEANDLVLAGDLALELGNPRDGSLLSLMWSETAVTDGRIVTVGPTTFAEGVNAPLYQVYFLCAQFDDEYEASCALKDAVHETTLRGVTARAMPSRQTLWLRIDRDALTHDFTPVQWSAEIIWRLRDVPGVVGVESLIITDPSIDLAPLLRAAEETGRLVGAMNKMREEMSYDCDSCEYWDVCATVEQLKAQRAKLAGSKS